MERFAMDKEVLIMRVQCCVCKKVKNGGTWREAPEAQLADLASHSYCPVCLAEAERNIRAERTEFLMAAQRRLASAAP